MRRLHLFEWEDQPWLPEVLRDFITDQLRYTLNEPMRRPVNEAIAARLKSLLEAARTTHIVDLCAGAGGPMPAISRILTEDLDCPVQVLLTDFYPNVAALRKLEAESGGRIHARLDSTNALDVPRELAGVRTLFTAFHHFRPQAARAVLADAVQKDAAIAIFEPLERTLRMVALVGAVSFLRGFTHTPRVGRLTASRFFFTYVLPIAPFLFAWDGMVSALRSYTPAELLELAQGHETSRYSWEAGRFEVSGPFGPMPTIYLIGTPARSG